MSAHETVISPPVPTNPFGWIRNETFDVTLIMGVAGLSLISGWLICLYPELFPRILFMDLWFLGYHHVVATFTRLTFDMDSYREHKFLVVWVPIILVAVLVPLVYLLGSWILATGYLYWQWYHYMRQSFGISRVYQRKAGLHSARDNYLEEAVIYSVPVWGILYRSFQNPGTFLGLPLKVIPVPPELVKAVGILTIIILGVWLGTKLLAFTQQRLAVAHTLYQTSHILVFWTAYILIPDLNVGWLVMNIWHNAQYVLFVWMYNNHRFKKGVDPAHWFLSTISQTQNKFLYFGVCIFIAGLVYKMIDLFLVYFKAPVLPFAVLVYQTINFHHYIVDGVVWKIRKKPIQQTLGLTAPV